jgi:outer membrane protein OmpA-like peptidoglycan-associated protein
LQRYYVVNYIFPPKGALELEPASLTIEEVKTFDASPMLGHIYFAEGESSIPEQYVRLEGDAQIEAFDESRFEDTLEKYYQVLNILGKRMVDHPDTAITLIGCNANTGVEKGNKELSAARAQAVRDYLLSVWRIAPERIAVESRNLPAMPSASRLDEGKADNRRVEVLTESPELLDLVRSTYIAYRTDASFLTVKAEADSAYGFVGWHVAVVNADGMVTERRGEGAPPSVVVAPLATKSLEELAAGGDLMVTLLAEDKQGQALEVNASPVPVNFIQTSQLLARQQGYLAQEKYALILFAFDSDSIGDRNQAIVAEIVARIRELPEAQVSIIGHTDNIGKQEYNLKLSERRARSVYDQIIDFYGEEDAERITYQGVGADAPLYDNVTPEARAFNRTVTITLEYLAGE